VDCKEFLKQLSETPGVSGYEGPVREVVTREFEKYADEIRVDTMGSVIALRRGQGAEPRRRIMLAGHMDEIGLMVKKIKDGFLHVSQVGGIDSRILQGQEVVVHGKRDLPGIIGSRPPHVLPPEEREKIVPMEQIFVDVGLSEEELPKWVRVGDLISFRRSFTALQGEWASGNAFDNRVGVVVVGACLATLAERWKHAWDVYAVATCQEEITMLGALTATYGIRPDIGIAIDVTFGGFSDSPENGTFVMDGGPALAYGPNVHPKLHEMLVETAKEMEIPYQVEPIPRGSGTDAWGIQVTREGVPTAVLVVPLRYMHTPVETVCIKDIERAGRLLAGFIARLDDSTIEKMTPRLEAEA